MTTNNRKYSKQEWARIKKKREQIAKAIEKEHPNIPMDQKMAIATSAAEKALGESKNLNNSLGYFDFLKKLKQYKAY
jgi:hypothetical protein